MWLNIMCEQGLRSDTHIVLRLNIRCERGFLEVIVTLSMMLSIMCEQGLRSNTHIV